VNQLAYPASVEEQVGSLLGCYMLLIGLFVTKALQWITR